MDRCVGCFGVVSFFCSVFWDLGVCWVVFFVLVYLFCFVCGVGLVVTLVCWVFGDFGFCGYFLWLLG